MVSISLTSTPGTKIKKWNKRRMITTNSFSIKQYIIDDINASVLLCFFYSDILFRVKVLFSSVLLHRLVTNNLMNYKFSFFFTSRDNKCKSRVRVKWKQKEETYKFNLCQKIQIDDMLREFRGHSMAEW